MVARCAQEKIPSAIIPLEQLAVREVDLTGLLDMGPQRFPLELYNPDIEVRGLGTDNPCGAPASASPL